VKNSSNSILSSSRSQKHKISRSNRAEVMREIQSTLKKKCFILIFMSAMMIKSYSQQSFSLIIKVIKKENWNFKYSSSIVSLSNILTDFINKITDIHLLLSHSLWMKLLQSVTLLNKISICWTKHGPISNTLRMSRLPILMRLISLKYNFSFSITNLSAGRKLNQTLFSLQK